MASGQEYVANVKHFTGKDGLSHREAFCSIQDSRGFIWVGTKYGLNRFNGYDFEIFSKEKNGLSSNEIHYLLEDNQGWLWMFQCPTYLNQSDFENISFLNIHTFEFKTWEQRYGHITNITARQIYSAIKDDYGKICLGTKDGRLVIINHEVDFEVYPIENGKDILLKYATEKGTLIAQNLNFRDHINIEKGPLIEIDLSGNVVWTDEESFSIEPITEIENTRYYAHRSLNESGLFDVKFYQSQSHNEYQLVQIEIPKYNEQKPSRRTLRIYYHPQNDIFWQKSADHFFVFNLEKGVLYDFEENYPGIISNQINDIDFDNQENAWVSTGNGIYKIKLKPSPFTKFLSLSQEDYSLNKGFSTRGITVHDQKMYVNSVMNVQFQVNLQNKEAIRLPKLILQQKGFSERLGVIFNPILAGDSKELLFGGTVFSFFDTKTFTQRPIFWENENYNNIAWTLFEDNRGRYWTGLHEVGLAYLDLTTNKVVAYEQYNEFSALSVSTVYSFLQLDADHLLVGSNVGIFLLHLSKGIIARWWSGGVGEEYLPQDNIHHLHQDRIDNQKIWAATGGGGIMEITLSKQDEDTVPSIKTYTQYTIVDGLSNNVTYAVYEDSLKNLWIPSDYGIMRMDKTSKVVEVFFVEDGITHNEFNRISHYQDKDGTLYFGGLNGVTMFHPNDITKRDFAFKAPLEIMKFQQYIGEKEDIVDKTMELQQGGTIILQPGDRFFTLNFALLDYQDAAQIGYAYKIEGQSENWEYIQENSLRVSGLPYGDYTLNIKGRGANGQFSSEELKIPIHVLKPFYLQRWFLITTILSFSLLSFYLYKRRTKQYEKRQFELETAVKEATKTIRNQNEELKQLDKVRSRLFANISHELRTPITLILGPLASILKSEKLDGRNRTFADLSYKNAKSLLFLVNEILSLTKLESGKLVLQEAPTALFQLIKRLTVSFQGVAAQKKINYNLIYHLPQDLLIKIDSKKFEKVLNNLLSNAFKFTRNGGSITVQVEEQIPHIQLTIKDTGRGIHPEDLPYIFDRFYQSSQVEFPKEGGTGIGLALSMELAKLMNGDLKVESSLGKGSIFYFRVPLEKSSSIVQNGLGVIDEANTSFISELEETEADQIETELLLAKKAVNDSKLLLIEDNESLRDYIQLILGEKYDLATVGNGKEALKYLNDHSKNLPQLIISDIMMPEMDGYQLLEKLKESERFRNIPIIMLTALAELKDRLKALRIGIDDYMTKPFEEEELLARVDNLLANSYRRIAFEKEAVEDHKGNTELVDCNNSFSVDSTTLEDNQWLNALETTTRTKIGDFHFTVEQLASEMALSRWQLNRRIKQLTGLTANAYIQEIRLNVARNLLEMRKYNSVKSVIYEIGVKDRKNFSKHFRKRFGKLPSEFMQ